MSEHEEADDPNPEIEPVLTAEQHELVVQTLPIIPPRARAVARRSHARLEVADLCSVGKIALYKAVRGYLHAFNRSFEYYAGCLVWVALLDEARKVAVYEGYQAAAAEAILLFCAYQEEADAIKAWAYTDEENQAEADAFAAGLAGAGFMAGLMGEANDESGDDPESRLDRARARAMLEEALKGLRPPELATVMLLYGKLMSQVDAAAEMKVNTATVWRREQSALVRLRKAFGLPRVIAAGGGKRQARAR